MTERDYTLTEPRARQIFFQIVCAVEYLHSLGIIHRDLKLENIMMTDSTNEARAKVIDFGLARFLHPGQTANDAFGTPGYTAPEVLMESNYSFACDVWSLGCILYALLTGTMPFDCQSSYEKMKLQTIK